MRQRYSKWLDACMTREDVNFVLSEMAGELAVGHAYASNGGDVEQPPRVPTGMLGADFELHNGAYRITRIYEGSAWDTNSRGPLSQPGIKVKAGDYLLAVNGKPIETGRDPWAAFVDLAGKDTEITVSEKPVIDSSSRRIVVKLPAPTLGFVTRPGSKPIAHMSLSGPADGSATFTSQISQLRD
jgi:tricorn protease